jgi:hypothetical protein
MTARSSPGADARRSSSPRATPFAPSTPCSPTSTCRARPCSCSPARSPAASAFSPPTAKRSRRAIASTRGRDAGRTRRLSRLENGRAQCPGRVDDRAGRDSSASPGRGAALRPARGTRRASGRGPRRLLRPGSSALPPLLAAARSAWCARARAAVARTGTRRRPTVNQARPAAPSASASTPGRRRLVDVGAARATIEPPPQAAIPRPRDRSRSIPRAARRPGRRCRRRRRRTASVVVHRFESTVSAEHARPARVRSGRAGKRARLVSKNVRLGRALGARRRGRAVDAAEPVSSTSRCRGAPTRSRSLATRRHLPRPARSARRAGAITSRVAGEPRAGPRRRAAARKPRPASAERRALDPERQLELERAPTPPRPRRPEPAARRSRP